MTFNFKDEINSDLFLSDVYVLMQNGLTLDGLVFEFTNVLLEKILVLVMVLVAYGL